MKTRYDHTPNHYVTVTLPNGKTARGRVVYLQPKADRWRDTTAAVHILCSEWLEPYWHPATCRTVDEWFDGQFMPTTYESSGNDWLFKGTFERNLLSTNKNSASFRMQS